MVGGRGISGRSSLGRKRGFGMGVGGECMCTDPKCNHIVAHQRGIPCYELKCSKCGSPMIRKN